MTQPKDSERIEFESMNPLQRRLHNAALVLEADGDEYGFVALLREVIATIAQSQQEAYRVQVVREDGSTNGKPHYKDTKEDLDRDLQFLHDDGYKTVVTALYSATPPAQLTVPEGLEELKLNFILACKALDDLSFSCFSGIGISAPTLKVYNETFSVLEKMRPLYKAMLAAPTLSQGDEG